MSLSEPNATLAPRPKLSQRSLRTLRMGQARATSKYRIDGKKNTSVKPVTLRTIPSLARGDDK